MKIRTTALAAALMTASVGVLPCPRKPRPSVDGTAGGVGGMAVMDGTAADGGLGGREPDWASPLERS